LGPWGTAGGAIIGGLAGLLSGDGSSNSAAAPAAVQYGGNSLTDQLAALQYSQGLQQQQAQNAREAALYGNANANFDIGNAAQLRQGPQIAASLADQKRQLAALGATNAGIGNMNSTGNLLTSMGTAPMGPSYAEAQLRQGQSDAMAQQLSMARSGRSLGSGQAAMNQAAFNNAALNQSTNQAAASARLQEQQNYNQFQLGALQGAGNAYGTAGGLAGQAGNQATTIRSGNEGLQAQNAALTQSQQQINNQTTGMYNQLGAQQQQLGMQANRQGQDAYQFGQQQAAQAIGAQANADTGRLSSITTTNLANQDNANLHDAANMNMAASGFGAAANAVSGAVGGSTPAVNQNNPSGSTSPYSNIGTASHSTDTSSDERLKTNIKALGGGLGGTATAAAAPIRPGMIAAPSAAATAANSAKYAGFSPEDAAAYRAADAAAASGQDTYTANGSTQVLHPFGNAAMDDQDAGKQAVDVGYNPASYAETISALNNAYRPSQFAGADVLNHVAGAGAGPSASQAAVIASMTGKKPSALPLAAQSGGINAHAQAADYGVHDQAPLTGDQLSALAHSAVLRPPAAAASPGIRYQKVPLTGASRVQAAAPAPAAAWGDVFNAPALDPRVTAYLNGANPTPRAPAADVYKPAPYVPAPVTESDMMRDSQSGSPSLYASDYSPEDNASSDVHSKTRIRQLETQLAALQGPPSASFTPQQPDTAALDQAYAREQSAPAIDLRPAQGYSYEYKDPRAPGAAPGRQVGPMAQDLEHTAAAAAVHDTPHGKVVDTPRLTMVNTAALSEQQRKTQELERQLAALSGSGLGPMPAHDQALYAQPGRF
jgi:hypothetical protein